MAARFATLQHYCMVGAVGESCSSQSQRTRFATGLLLYSRFGLGEEGWGLGRNDLNENRFQFDFFSFCFFFLYQRRRRQSPPPVRIFCSTRECIGVNLIITNRNHRSHHVIKSTISIGSCVYETFSSHFLSVVLEQ